MIWVYQTNVNMIITCVDSDMDEYIRSDEGCLSERYSPPDTSAFYVEVTLNGCKHLCQQLHDVTCTRIVFLPTYRSCYLQPDRKVSLMGNSDDCVAVMVFNSQTSNS